MANTNIKAGMFYGVVGHGTDGYFLMSNGDGSMTWGQASTGPSVTSVTYPGDDTAADPAGGQTVILTGTGFATSGMTVTIGGTAAPSVAHTSNTQLTITTPAKAAGDYDIVVTNGFTGASGTFVNGISYNGVPTWTTAAGSLGTFESETTISTITLQATEPDGGTITFNITNGALPSGLSLTGANIDGTTTAESSTTLYSFTIEAIDDENQSTPRNFSITVNAAAIISSENFTINTYTGNGSTQSIEGKIGTAASFNGSSSAINLGSTNQFASSGVSVSMWINPVSITTNQMLIANQNGGSFAEGDFFIMIRTDGYIGYEIGQSASIYEARYATTTQLTANTWQHILMTFDSSLGTTIGKIYVNGTLQSTSATYAAGGTFSGDVFIGTLDLQLGKRNISGSELWYNGKIDQVRVFNKALSSSEVTTLYGENNTSSTKSTTDIFNDGSGVALYEFEKGAIDTGGTYNGTPTNVSFIGTSFQPDLVWIKQRSSPAEPHALFDSVRGANQSLWSDSDTYERDWTAFSTLNSFDSNGFTLGSDSTQRVNLNGGSYVAWCWKAGGAAVSNTDGTITSTVSANPDAGFSIVKFTSPSTNVTGFTIGHGLSATPDLIITKPTDAAVGWHVYSSQFTTPSQSYLQLQLTDAALTGNTNIWNNTAATSTVFSMKTGYAIGTSSEAIAYCFHSVDGYQKVGSYTGNGSSGGQTITGLGFNPRFLLVKHAAASAAWRITDSVRGDNIYLYPNLANADDSSSGYISLITDGFRLNGLDSNASGTYIYLAIA